MSTVGKHIAAIRGMLNAFSETEVPFSDEFIYHHLVSTAAYYTRQKYDKTNRYNYQNFKFYTVPTQRGTMEDCGCVGLCEVLQSKYPVPKMLLTRNGPLLFVRTINHQDIPYIDIAYVDSLKYDDVRKGQVHYSLINQRVVLHNTDLRRPKAIIVGGSPIDVTEWMQVNICDPDGENEQSPCAELYDLDMMIDVELTDVIYTQTLQKLRNGERPADRTNEGSN